METADMVKVAVSAAPYSIDKPYSYLVPESLAAAAVPGVRVMVPFGRGNKESEGLILARVQEPKLPGSKAIRQILDSEPVLDKAGIDLALWMRGRYFCTVFEAVKTILPAGLWYGLREIWSLAMEPEAARSAAVGIPGAWQVLDLLEPIRSACGSLPVEEGYTMAQLGRACGIAVGAAVVTVLN